MPGRTSIPPASAAVDAAARARILAAARTHFFSFGYSALTMDDLASALGVSKKTLYRHFPAKDALVGEILEEFAAEVRGMADTLFADDTLPFTAKLHQFTAAMVRRFAAMKPHIIRDLERSAPQVYRRIEDLRFHNIPHIFGQIFRQGQAAGMIRRDVDAAFAVEFWRNAIQGLMHPASLDRMKLSPDQMFEQAIDLFFAGFLTAAGRKDYEKHVAP